MSFLRSFTEFKVRLQRSLSYVALVNAAMIGFLFLDKLKAYGFEYNVVWAAPLVLGGTVVLCDVLGRIDQYFGFHQEEIKIQMENNPQLNEVLKEVKEIKELMLE